MKLLIVYITENDKMEYTHNHVTSGIGGLYSGMEYIKEDEIKQIYKNKQFFCISQVDDNYIGVYLDTWYKIPELSISIHEYASIPERYLDDTLVIFIDNKRANKLTKQLAVNVLDDLLSAENNKMWLWCDNLDDLPKMKQDAKIIMSSSDPYTMYEQYIQDND